MQRIFLQSDAYDSAVNQAAKVLREGGILIFPTETMYGVGVDATNPEAVTKLLKYKERPAGKPISVLVGGLSMAERCVEVNEAAKGLYKSFLPGPVTIVSKDKGLVDSRLCSEFGTLGIRVSSHPFVQALVQSYGKPITATSANASGKARPYDIATLLQGLRPAQQDQIDLILDEGLLPRREPSTVIDTTTKVQSIIRAGADFVDLAPPILSSSESHTITIASDMMKSLFHSLPEKPVVFALEGEMGAGKTRFAKGVAEALKVCQPVSSPTFTLMKEYEGKSGETPVLLTHIDCWRTPEITADELLLPELLHPNSVLVIEWAEPLLEYLREKFQIDEVVGYRIIITSTDEQTRQIRIAHL